MIGNKTFRPTLHNNKNNIIINKYYLFCRLHN